MKLLREVHYEYIMGTDEICMLSSLLAVQWALCHLWAFRSQYSQVADWKFTKCILGSTVKCAKHPVIAAAAVMDALKLYMHKICDHKGTGVTADLSDGQSTEL